MRLATFAAGMRYKQRADLMLAAFDEGTRVAGVFTRSMCPSAPVLWCKRIVDAGRARALVVNAGNANAFTGRAGDVSTKLTADTIAEVLRIDAQEVFLASTGVIGENLPDDTLRDALPRLIQELQEPRSERWEAAARAITTTDTFAKGAFAEAVLGDERIPIVGIAKGSGMIQPDMATMLCFLFTDVALPPEILQQCLTEVTDRTFNCITVDSDTSTSDTALLFATGQRSLVQPVTRGDSRVKGFADALHTVMLDLSHQVVRDGEGASKFVEITVQGAESDSAARKVAFAVGNSPLVKTALAAGDANWGRIVMAVGKAGQAANRDRLDIWIGGLPCARSGQRAPEYDEKSVTAHLQGEEIRIRIDLGIGKGQATIWTCDLTEQYIHINARYRS